jgi:hypothetical protein
MRLKNAAGARLKVLSRIALVSDMYDELPSIEAEWC